MQLACVAVDDTLHQPEHNFVRVIPYINSPLFTNGMPSMQIGFVHACLSKSSRNRLVPLLADDVVASVRRMYADDYSLVKRLAGFDLDELLANATSA